MLSVDCSDVSWFALVMLAGNEMDGTEEDIAGVAGDGAAEVP